MKGKEKLKTVQMRLPESLHETLKQEAKKEGIYLNMFYIKTLESGLNIFLSRLLTLHNDKR